jgi:hypothetical protein
MIKLIVELHSTEKVLKKIYFGCVPVQVAENRKRSGGPSFRTLVKLESSKSGVRTS